MLSSSAPGWRTLALRALGLPRLPVPELDDAAAGQPYDGPDPASGLPPVQAAVNVEQLRAGARGRYLLRTSAGEFDCRNVVIATGPY